MTDLISIILPCYNGANTICDTIDTVLSQTYTNWELIVIDDCSVDSSVRIIRSYLENDKRIRLIELGENSGRPAIPRNIGCSVAEGTYIAFLDADDLWHKQKLELQLGFMIDNKAKFCSTNIVKFNDRAEVELLEKVHFSQVQVKESITHDRLIRKNTICNSSVMLEKQLMDRVDFIEDIRYKAIEDYHCWLMIHQFHVLKSPVIFEKLVFYRLAATSISRSKYFMFQKNAILYSEYIVNGKKLGYKKYLYLITYGYYSLLRKLRQ
ncbi:MAG: glycosyltransferase family 2 protein [Ignavibacteria bacterium]|nr:glycosyltransferase family 2 protein [Ignavibacteria bacterium]